MLFINNAVNKQTLGVCGGELEGSWGGGGGHTDDKKGICFLKGTESWWVMDTPGHAVEDSGRCAKGGAQGRRP